MQCRGRDLLTLYRVEGDEVEANRGVNTRPLLHVRCYRGILGTLLGLLRPQGGSY
jgi:hypothetical protein